MRPGNPACYECPKGDGGMHAWQRNEDGSARCRNCKLKLSKDDADDVFGRHICNFCAQERES